MTKYTIEIEVTDPDVNPRTLRWLLDEAGEVGQIMTDAYTISKLDGWSDRTWVSFIRAIEAIDEVAGSFDEDLENN